MNKSSLLSIAAITYVSWAIWYKLVLTRVMHRNSTWGPRWLAVFLSGVTRWLAEKLGGCTFATSQESLPDRQVIMGCHPHGVYMITAAFFGTRIFCNPANNPTWFICVQDLLFRIPGVSEYLALVNGRSADKRSLDDLLKSGFSVGVVPGGIHEQVRTDPDREAVYFPPNLGFIRLAIEHGVPLWPVYIFGENQLYGQNKFTRSLNRSLKKYFGMGSLFVIGRFGLPWPVFKPTPLYLQYGNIVEVGPPNPNPSDEFVRGVFLQYAKELRRIFASSASTRIPPENAKRGLQIVWRGHHEEEPILSSL